MDVYRKKKTEEDARTVPRAMKRIKLVVWVLQVSVSVIRMSFSALEDRIGGQSRSEGRIGINGQDWPSFLSLTFDFCVSSRRHEHCSLRCRLGHN